MLPVLVLCLLAAGRCESSGGAPDDQGGGGLHQVRIVNRAGQILFEPSRLEIRAGETVRFELGTPHPQSVAFDTSTAPPDIRAYLRRSRLDRRPLLTQPGQAYDVTFDGAPPGAYSFYSLAHASPGAGGTVIVTE